MTREEFVEDAMYELEGDFNANRPEHKRVKKRKDKQRVRKGLERGYDLREQNADVETIEKEVRKAVVGNPLVAWLISFIISNYGDEIIAWILKMLFPNPQAPPFSSEGVQ